MELVLKYILFSIAIIGMFAIAYYFTYKLRKNSFMEGGQQNTYKALSETVASELLNKTKGFAIGISDAMLFSFNKLKNSNPLIHNGTEDGVRSAMIFKLLNIRSEHIATEKIRETLNKAAEELKHDRMQWKDFEGKSNTNELLLSKAAKLAHQLVAYSYDLTKEDSQKIMFYEILALFLHVIDRNSFELLGKESRNTFMDSLLDNIIFDLTDEFGSRSNELIKAFRNLYNHRQAEYSPLKLYPNINDPMGGTLFWEFSKKWMAQQGKDWKSDPCALDKKCISLLSALAYLNIKKLLLGIDGKET